MSRRQQHVISDQDIICRVSRFIPVIWQHLASPHSTAALPTTDDLAHGSSQRQAEKVNL